MATVQDIISRAREVLNDPDKTRWADSVLIYWINDALSLLRFASPRLFSLRGNHSCNAGALQSLIFDRARELIGVIGVLPCDQRAIDAFNPSWQTSSSGAALNWMPSATALKDFLLYPPSFQGQQLIVEYVETPEKMEFLIDDIPVPDDYVSALSDYVIGMAESKDAEHVVSGRAQVFMQAFASKLGVKTPSQPPVGA